ncbi:hypothetical protein [Hyphomonas sp.]|uniref:hypothetical protein n=1 Tax=Hyphomonas sp. TaxID=87 RepID=UPI00329786A5
MNAFVRLDQRALVAPQFGAGEAASAVVSKKMKGSGEMSSRGSRNQSGQNVNECLANTNETTRNPFGTKRQSAVMVSMWHTVMPEQDAKAVWEACETSGAMDALGYDP